MRRGSQRGFSGPAWRKRGGLLACRAKRLLCDAQLQGSYHISADTLDMRSKEWAEEMIGKFTFVSNNFQQHLAHGQVRGPLHLSMGLLLFLGSNDDDICNYTSESHCSFEENKSVTFRSTVFRISLRNAEIYQTISYSSPTLRYSNVEPVSAAARPPEKCIIAAA